MQEVKPKSGDTVRVVTDNWYVDINEYTLEVFHHCLGYFKAENDRKACKFTPLSSLLEPSPDAERVYLSHYGEVATKFVQTYEVIRNG